MFVEKSHRDDEQKLIKKIGKIERTQQAGMHAEGEREKESVREEKTK